MIKLQRSASFYRPYVTVVNNVARTVNNIIIYDENGVIFRIDSGWFEKRDSYPKDIEELTIDCDKEILYRKKEKFDGEVFILSVQREYAVNEKHCDLYMPNSLMKFKIVNKHISKLFNYALIEAWESETTKAYYENHIHLGLNKKLKSLEKEFEDIKKDYKFKLSEKNILEKVIHIQELAEQYQKETIRLDSLTVEEVLKIKVEMEKRENE